MTKKILYFLFVLLLLAPVTGELWRLNLFGLDFLPSDLIIPILLVVWGIYKIQSDRKIRIGKVGKAIFIFLFVVVVTYFLNMFRFDTNQMIYSFSALGRLGMYVLLAGVTFDLLNRDKEGKFRKLVITAMIVSMVLLAVLGFMQLKFFGNFFELGMHLRGWDPHIGRLLSTWFDPNFIGGYLSFILSIVIALGLYFHHKHNKKWFYLMAAISVFGLVALYLTYSRSAYLALIVSLGILALMKSRKLLIVGALVIALGFSSSPSPSSFSLSIIDFNQRPANETAAGIP